MSEQFLGEIWTKIGTKIVKVYTQSEVEDLFKILTDPRKELHDFHIMSNDILQIEWNDDPLFLHFDSKTNVFLASFTTMWARLRLYSILNAFDRDVLYYDTDSVVFRCSKTNHDLSYLPVENYLGELTNEISPEDGFIEEFVSGGTKNYAYRANLGKEECKVRGFTLNLTNAKLINFSAIKSMICDSNIQEISPIREKYPAMRENVNYTIGQRSKCTRWCIQNAELLKILTLFLSVSKYSEGK